MGNKGDPTSLANFSDIRQVGLIVARVVADAGQTSNPGLSLAPLV
jgi:hypothetical protein